MELLRNFSDNELALAGCLGALIVSFGLLGGSYHLGRIVRRRRAETDVSPESRSVSTTPQESTRRRAA